MKRPIDYLFQLGRYLVYPTKLIPKYYKPFKQTEMTLNDFQQRALGTAIYPANQRLIYPTLGLAGEAGEVANKVKKILRDNNGEITDEICENIAGELGDVLWYVAVTARDLGMSLEQIASANIQKLEDRKKRGTLGGNGDKR